MNISKKQLWTVVGLYFLMSFIAMMPTSFSPTEYKYGNFKGSDSFIHINMHWFDVNIWDKNEEGETWNYYRGAPSGHTHRISYLTQWMAMPFTFISNGIFSYNAVIFLSFIFSGLMTFFLVHRYTNCLYSSFLSGVIFAMSPYHQLQGADHINLAQVWIFPAFLYLFMNFIEDKSYRNAVILGLLTGATAWLHGYYVLYLFFSYGFLVLALLILKKLELDKDTIIKVVITLAIASVLTLIWLKATNIVTGVDGGGKVASDYNKPIQDLQKYGIRLYEYFLPPYYSNLFGSITKPIWLKNHHGSNFPEMTLFLGFLPIILIVMTFLKFKKKVIKMKKVDPKVITLAIVCGVIFFIPLLIAMPPKIKIFSLEIPTLSNLSYMVFPMLRTLSRMAILSITATSILAGLSFYFLFKKKNDATKKKMAILFSFIIFLEFGNFGFDFYLDSSNVPAVYQEVSKLDDKAIILEIPFGWGYFPNFWQQYHKKKMFNVFKKGHKNFEEIVKIQKMKQLGQIIQRCKELGITHLIYHSPKPVNIGGKVYKNKLDQHSILPNYAQYSSILEIK